MRITALAGGTGAAKLLRGLGPLVDPRSLTVIVNTGDDTEIWGLHVSPDLDTVCYTLGGVIDEGKGWGLADETFHTLDQIARFGEPLWFNLGDRDLATHLHRTRLLREGRTLSEATRAIASALGVSATVLPMSDQPVRTRILGPDGWLAFQEYFVREKAQVEVRAVEYAGAATARPAPGVVEAIGTADIVLVCPSNPITSSTSSSIARASSRRSRGDRAGTSRCLALTRSLTGTAAMRPLVMPPRACRGCGARARSRPHGST